MGVAFGFAVQQIKDSVIAFSQELVLPFFAFGVYPEALEGRRHPVGVAVKKVFNPEEALPSPQYKTARDAPFQRVAATLLATAIRKRIRELFLSSRLCGWM